MGTMTTPETVPTQAETTIHDQRIVLRGIDWALYEALATALGSQHVHLTYDRGDLELMSPSPSHERYKKFLGHLVEALLVELRIPSEPAGESRRKREAAQRGLESDESYFIDPAKLAIIRGRPADRPDDPLPDLAIEIEFTSSAVNKLSVYAALGIPEVWRLDAEKLQILELGVNGAYVPGKESRFLPVRPGELFHWIQQADGTDLVTWSLMLRDWIRDDVALRHSARNLG